MTKPVLVLRPEPGASATALKGEACGLVVRKCPLFAAAAVIWHVPEPAPGTRLLLTSANAARLGGPQLLALRHLPCWCVGPATAEAARAAGLSVVHAGDGDASAVAAAMGIDGAVLWLCGVQRSAPDWPEGMRVNAVPVYAMNDLPVAHDALSGPVIALVHSARAARRLAALVATNRDVIDIVAISRAVADAAGGGWRSVAAADRPTDQAMIDMALQLQGNHGPFRPAR